MSRAQSFSLVLVAAVLLSGCVVYSGGSRGDGREASWQQLERENREHIARLTPGQEVEAVRRRMGTPAFTESFFQDQRHYKVLFYRTHRARADGMTTRDETTPLIFAEGLLESWGEEAWVRLTGRPLADFN